eukprot:scaffold36871_cov49-Phaeocystis_antarctica.AAC.1
MPTLAVESRTEGIRCWAGFGPGGGRQRATAAHAACRGGLDCRFGARQRGGVHLEHGAHGRDAGGVEAQRLVERLRFLPERGYAVRGEVQSTGRAGDGRRPRDTQRAWGGARLQVGGRARGGAHDEHVLHVRDAGRVEGQRLVERRRLLSRVERRGYDAGRGSGREAGGSGRPRCKRRAGEGSTAGGSRVRGGAHVSKLSGWLNADAPCADSRTEGTRCWARFGPGGERRRATAAHAACRRGLDCRLGAGHGEERTRNMLSMVVTLEVSKLSGWLNAFASCRKEGMRCG